MSTHCETCLDRKQIAYEVARISDGSGNLIDVPVVWVPCPTCT